MLTEERRDGIIQWLQADGKVLVKELSKRFKISEVTIRTDLIELQKRGLLRKSHGGAVLPAPGGGDPKLREEFRAHSAEKVRIGEAAAELIRNNETIILDSGIITQEIAKRIKNRQNLKIITNGVNIAMELVGVGGVQVILLGGVLRSNSFSVVGHFAEDMLKHLNADKLFIAADGCAMDFGISTPNMEESRVNQAMVTISREKYLTADSSKFGKSSLSRIGSLWDMTGVISDEGLSEEFRAEIEAHGLNLILA
jgi:DeoR family transcriptional regulator of aga operon